MMITFTLHFMHYKNRCMFILKHFSRLEYLFVQYLQVTILRTDVCCCTFEELFWFALYCHTRTRPSIPARSSKIFNFSEKIVVFKQEMLR